MGGYGSGRWGWARTRDTTADALRLDVRSLARRGLFAAGPGSVAEGEVRWGRGNDVTDWIAVTYAGDRPGEVVLDYRTRRPGEEWVPVRERVAMDRTACPYGGGRPWFRCPGCGSRRAVLYCAGGRFRCRACHELAYASTREGAADRAHRRAETLRTRLGVVATPGRGRRSVPDKPPGMRWATFERLARELAYAEHDALALWIADSDALLARLDRRYGPLG